MVARNLSPRWVGAWRREEERRVGKGGRERREGERREWEGPGEGVGEGEGEGEGEIDS